MVDVEHSNVIGSNDVYQSTKHLTELKTSFAMINPVFIFLSALLNEKGVTQNHSQNLLLALG